MIVVVIVVDVFKAFVFIHQIVVNFIVNIKNITIILYMQTNYTFRITYLSQCQEPLVRDRRHDLPLSSITVLEHAQEYYDTSKGKTSFAC